MTPEEQRRAERFSLFSKQMEDDGYVMRDCDVGLLKANILAGIVMLPFAILSIVMFFVTLTLKEAELVPVNMMLVLVLFFALMVLHEAIHCLTWGIFAKEHLKAIEFSMVWKYLTPYCTCANPLSKSHYILGGIMPTLILGFGLFALSCFFTSSLLQILSVFLIFGGGGDFIILLKIVKFPTKGKIVLFYDHPYECGFVAFEKPDK